MFCVYTGRAIRKCLPIGLLPDQSYTTGEVCEFPDAYVEPYPEFFAKIAEYAERGERLITSLDLQGVDGPANHFDTLYTIASTLREMAEHQRTGTPHSDEHLAFINQAVSVETICGGAYAEGWYADLVVFDPNPTHEAAIQVHGNSDDFGVLVDAAGVSGSEIGLHTAASKYASLAKNAYFTGSGTATTRVRGPSWRASTMICRLKSSSSITSTVGE